MRLVNPKDPLVSNEMLIENGLKVLAEIDAPTELLASKLEQILTLDATAAKQGRIDLIEGTIISLLDLKEWLEEEDHNLRGFVRETNYFESVLDELEARAHDSEDGRSSEPEYYGSIWDDKKPPPKAELNE